jgi:hypothetical protein
MTFALRSTRPLLVLAGITLWACADKLGIHQLVLEQGETEGAANCVLLTDDGSTSGGTGRAVVESDADYRQYQKMSGGHATFTFTLPPEPGDEAEQQPGVPGVGVEPGVLALEIDIYLDSFGRGARRDHFDTRDGVEHAVYTWAEADCEQFRRSVPQWVLDKVAAP